MHKSTITDPAFTREELLARHALELAWFESTHTASGAPKRARKNVTPAATKAPKRVTTPVVKTPARKVLTDAEARELLTRLAKTQHVAPKHAHNPLADFPEATWDDQDILVP